MEDLLDLERLPIDRAGSAEYVALVNRYRGNLEPDGIFKAHRKPRLQIGGEGKLTGFKVGGSWHFKATDIKRWIDKKKGKNK